MPSSDDRLSKRTGMVPIPGLKQSGLLSGPLPAGNSSTRQLPETSSQQNPVPATGQLPSFTPQTGQLTNANITRVLATMPPPLVESTMQRVPVVIKASMKRPAPAPPPLPPDLQKKRRLRVTLFGLFMLVLTIIVALFSATSLGHDIWLGNPLGLPGEHVIAGQSPGVSNLIAQATATAVYHRKTDGYDPSFFGSQLIGNGSTSLNWPLGQCTFWANYEYHQLTGHWVSWNGNADQWVTGARQAGWNVSTSPHVPSIMVMMPYTQNASGYGHVAVVESVSGNTVHTSNMNWWANGGGWNRVSNVDFTVGPGVYFIWHS